MEAYMVKKTTKKSKGGAGRIEFGFVPPGGSLGGPNL